MSDGVPVPRGPLSPGPPGGAALCGAQDPEEERGDAAGGDGELQQGAASAGATQGRHTREVSAAAAAMLALAWLANRLDRAC